MRAWHSLRLVAAAAMLVALIEGPGCAFLADIDAPATETCTNGKADRDKGELDIDCGGICRGACPNSGCANDTDCASSRCVDSHCALPACNDKVWNGAETDIDCGGPEGSCPRCENAKHCRVGSDCRSKQCEGGSCSGMCERCGEFIKTEPRPDPSVLCERTNYDNLAKCCGGLICGKFCGTNCEHIDTSECTSCLQKNTLTGCTAILDACRHEQ